jgi:hypothetical protein
MNNNNNSFNNISNGNNNVTNINQLTHTYFKGLSSALKKNMAKLNPLQKIILFAVFVVVPLILLITWLKNLYTTNSALSADYEDLLLTQNIPFIAAISVSNSDYMSFYKAFITYYYSSKISGDALNFRIRSGQLTDSLPNKYTYSFWINVTGYSEGLTAYVNNTLFNNGSVNRPITLTDYIWTNFRYGKYKEIFHRGDYYDNNIEDITTIAQYPGVWLGPKMNNVYIMLSNGSKNENFIIENISMNRWTHITCVLQGNSIGIYRDGKMEYSSYTNGTLYSSSIKNKNLYFLGNTTQNTGFPGFINEFKFYNRILSPENIELLYNKGLNKFNSLGTKVNNYAYSLDSNNSSLITNNSTVYSSVNSSLNCN